GDRAVLDTPGYDVQLSGTEGHVSIAELDRKAALDHQEQLVGVLMGVPDELALELGQLDLVVVETGHHLGRPVLREQPELVAEVHHVVHPSSWSSGSSPVPVVEVRPAASSRSAHSRSGVRAKTWSSMSSCRSPSAAYRSGTVKIVKSWGSQASTSSQRTGVETRASAKPRTEYAAAMVWSRAFWL